MTATAPTACARPGCDGVLDEGYCDVCGLAPVATGSGSSGSRPVPAAPVPFGPVPSGPATAAAGPATAAVGPATAAAGPATTAAPAATAAGSAGGSRGSRPSRRSTRTGSGRTGSTGTGRSRLGAGLVDVPPVPRVDPASVLLADPQVPEHRRFCSRCQRPVGRSRDGHPGRVAGFCPHDGHRFDYRPVLQPGDVVGGQYEVQGCLAHGGLGWIHLALDRNVEQRWVVLKGLLDSGDADAMAAAVAEKRFLAQVAHPGIVTIHNFVEHPGTDGDPVGYIVMEFVGGSSLAQLAAAGPLPVARAVAYALEILPALGYLHSLGLAYCDLKPDNVIQYGTQLKLIDLGGVIRTDDLTSAVFGTVGYQAPEVAAEGPSVQSDLFTVGRTLAVLTLGVPAGRLSLPADVPAADPVLARHESFHRLLLRATDPDPQRRFASADEMGDQLTAVLREVVAADEGVPRPGVSTLFGPVLGTFAADLLGTDAGGTDRSGTDASDRPDPVRVATALPAPLADTADPAAALLVTAPDPDDVLRLAVQASHPSPELRWAVVRAHLARGDGPAARSALDAHAAEDPDDWRLDWFRGLLALAAGDPAAALDPLETVLASWPGEAVPKLALAAAAEAAGDDGLAVRLYTVVHRTDAGVVDAAFGRARIALRAGSAADAVAALDAVPASAGGHVAAGLAAVRAGLAGRPDEAGLRAAAGRVERLPLDPVAGHSVRAALLRAAVPHAPADPGSGPPFLGAAWAERELRLAWEAALRASARLAADRPTRIALVDEANAVRPRTRT